MNGLNSDRRAGRRVELINLRRKLLRGDEEIAIGTDREAGRAKQVIGVRHQRRERVAREVVALDALIVADI